MYPSLSRVLKFLILAGFIFILGCSTAGQGNFSAFEISVDQSVKSEPVSGRVILMFSRTEEFRTGENGIPVFGVNVNDLRPADHAVVDETVLGYPVKSLMDIPEGDYFVQAYLNVYTTFQRSDGHTVKLHMDQGEGQRWQRSPGNLFSEPKEVHFNPNSGERISIVLDQIIPPIAPREDTEWVKNIRIQSRLLTDFWGQPMHIGAHILLPKGFEEHPNARYPVHYIQGHFPRGNPGGFNEDGSNQFSQAWMSDNFPRFITVTIDHANPYYDDSYGVNSENLGPYGDAIVTELIPEIERLFRGIGKPYSRTLSGGSTGGWIALAMQVFYPDFFGGTWSSYPDQVDFRYYQIVNIYDDDNAYYTEHEWSKVPRPGARSPDGNIRYTMEQENLLEEVIGDRYRSGGQWAVWNAVFAPVGEDGYPKPIWDPLTGEIDHESAEWAKENFDLRYILEQNWSTLGPKLAGKIHVFCGRMDNYYLNEAVYLLEEFLESTTSPYYAGEFQYGARGGHGWSPWSRGQHAVELTKVMGEHITNNAPRGENTRMWKY
ncbi:alpha/beta hydrolase-fold protein [candidate division KSB1 bacterium]